VNASIGLAEQMAGDTMKAVLDRADAEMYRDKAACRAAGNTSGR
jgi:PleD family two-component response regulator